MNQTLSLNLRDFHLSDTSLSCSSISSSSTLSAQRVRHGELQVTDRSPPLQDAYWGFTGPAGNTQVPQAGWWVGCALRVRMPRVCAFFCVCFLCQTAIASPAFHLPLTASRHLSANFLTPSSPPRRPLRTVTLLLVTRQIGYLHASCGLLNHKTGSLGVAHIISV